MAASHGGVFAFFGGRVKDEIHLLLQEYNNLWQEKLVHKQQLRKLNNYLSYLTSMASLALTLLGLSATEFFAKFMKDEGQQAFNYAAQAISLICIPFTPVVIVVLSFTLTELYHIYVMGLHIGGLEKRMNQLAQVAGPGLTWEHQVCALAYAEGGGKGESEATLNLVGFNTKWLLALPAALVSLITAVVGFKTLVRYDLWWLTVLVAAIYLSLIVAVMISGCKMMAYTAGKGGLQAGIAAINRQPAKDGQAKD